MTSKEILERLVGALLGDNNYYKQYVASTPIILQDKEVIEKDLEVLEIIKKKKVEVGELCEGCDNVNDYNKGVCLTYPQASDWVNYMLTETEFNLIKEWISQ